PTAEMKELLQKEQEEKSETTTEALDAIAAPEVEQQDRVPHKTMAPAARTMKRPDKPWSIIGRLVHVGDYVGYTKPWRDKWGGYNFLHSQKKLRTGPETILGIFCLFAMCLGIFLIPAAIKDADDQNSAALARQRLSDSVHEDLASESPQEDKEMESTKSNPPAVTNPGTANHTFTGNFAFSPDTEDLRFGRHLIVKGKIEAAIPYYERYLTLDPESNETRIELINAYIGTRQRYKARKLCIKAIKRASDPKELAALWQLLSQCQTD
ncbi:MAG TPA: tetratricopeptide repeat protein, partial [Candidatus Obscuribacterales bacterium]